MERNKIKTSIIIFLFMGLLTTSCEDAGDRIDNEMYSNEKSALTVRINNTIDRIDSKIDELEDRLDKANEKTAESINERIDKLKERREELKKDLWDLNNESDNTWKKFKSGVEETIDDIEEWINNIDIDLNIDTDSN